MIVLGEPLPPHPELAPRTPFQRGRDWISGELNGLLSYAVLQVFRLYESTLEVYAVGTEQLHRARHTGRPVLVALWHGHGLLPICYLEYQHLCLYASHTRDAATKTHPEDESVRELGLYMIREFGYEVVDASRYKTEAHGVVKYIHELKTSPGGVIAPDGPGGPPYVAKPGAAYIASRAGAVVVPVGVSYGSGLELDHWDRFGVPLPLSHCALAFGEGQVPPEKPTEADLNAAALRLQDSLQAQAARASSLLNSLI